MPANADGLLKRLLATFRPEAAEHIQAIASGLVELERAITEEKCSAVLDSIFRAAHSLKGAARIVNVTDIEALCQSLESVFAALKRGHLAVSAELFDLLHRTVDALGQCLRFIDTDATVAEKPQFADLLLALQAMVSEGPLPRPPAPTRQSPEPPAAATLNSLRSMADEKRGAGDTIRVATTKLDAVLLEAQEMLSAKLASAQHANRLQQCRAGLSEWTKRWTRLRPDLLAIRQTLERRRDLNGGSQQQLPWSRAMEFLDWSQDFISSLESELAGLTKNAQHDQRLIGTLVDNLLDDMKKVVMQPFSTLLDVFPRFVRELSREQGKEIDLQVRGEDIEIDRRILEEMKDPLIHLVRNCLDHGIETPDARARNGKPPRGTMAISIAARNGSSVELLITDDGAGIDANALKSVAVKSGLISPQKAATLGNPDAVSLIFQSGLSTSPLITDISGRGLGLSIVKEKVEKLHGAISVETQWGQGTTFRIKLPLTLARFRGILVRVNEQLFVLPTSSVERVIRLGKLDIKTVENRETIAFRGQVMSLARLDDVLNLPRKTPRELEPQTQLAVILASGDQRIAFVIDEALSEQEVLVKPLGKQLARVRNIAAATVLASGKVAAILNVPDLMRSAVRTSGTSARAPAAPQAAAARRKSVLVAEDSITSRFLLKNILETAGYQVETAVDGIDGYTKLRGGGFDLVVSDVEMPRMDGFGLTTRVRADRKLTELPVVLLTALESREDREHGIDVGANAYIVKSSFDQSNLLDVVRRLI